MLERQWTCSSMWVSSCCPRAEFFFVFFNVSTAFSFVQIPLLPNVLHSYGFCQHVGDLLSYVLYNGINDVFNSVSGK